MTDKDFYDRIDKARSLFTSREAVTRYCHDIRMLEDDSAWSNLGASWPKIRLKDQRVSVLIYHLIQNLLAP